MQTFEYQLLSRLAQDCEYYLGYGNRNPKNLWALDEHQHIAKMRELWDLLDEKPEWLTIDQIVEYERLMVDGW